MTDDIIERAEALLQRQRFQSAPYAGAAAIIAELVAALKAARAENERWKAMWANPTHETYESWIAGQQ